MDRNSLAGAGTAPANPDVIERAKELLGCAIKSTHHAEERIRDIIDRIAGAAPSQAPLQDGMTGTPQVQVITVAGLFGNLELAQAQLHRQIDRFREQAL